MMTWSPELLEYTRGRLLARGSRLWPPPGGGVRRPGRLRRGGAAAACLLLRHLAPHRRGGLQPGLLPLGGAPGLGRPGEFPWCQALAEHRFLKDVAYPRVNTEELAPCRELFHDALAPRVRGLSLEEAILEVNRWCAEEATYPLHRRPHGLAAAGVPAGLWPLRGGIHLSGDGPAQRGHCRPAGVRALVSHCDDNHAWVEAFDGQGWRYLGACEPEPPAGPGLVHPRRRPRGDGPHPGLCPGQAGRRSPSCSPRQTRWTGTSKRAWPWRTSPPATGQQSASRCRWPGPMAPRRQGPGCPLSVLNMAAPREIARRQADSQGCVTLGLGKGSVLATAWDEASPGLLAECLLAPEDTQAALVLGQGLARRWGVGLPAPGGRGPHRAGPFPQPGGGPPGLPGPRRRPAGGKAPGPGESPPCPARWGGRPGVAVPDGKGQGRGAVSPAAGGRPGRLCLGGPVPRRSFPGGAAVPPGGAGGAHPLAPAAGGALLPPGAGGRPPKSPAACGSGLKPPPPWTRIAMPPCGAPPRGCSRWGPPPARGSRCCSAPPAGLWAFPPSWWTACPRCGGGMASPPCGGRSPRRPSP